MKRYKTIFTVLLILLGGAFLKTNTLHAANPQIALKTNLVWDATASPNLALEVGVARRWTVQLGYGINAWGALTQDTRIRHWALIPEVRYWTCNRFVGHFIGLELIGGEFNLGKMDPFLYKWDDLKNYRLEGWMAGAGFMYGYQVPMSPHWNFEAVIGVGYVYHNYERYPCAECGTAQGRADWNYLGITKLGLSFMYLF